MRIVVLADSLSLPRVQSFIVRWEETWPYRLKDELKERGVDAEVINSGKRYRTIHDTLADFQDHVQLRGAQVLVLQVGIVDCAPRIISRRERIWLKLPVVPHWLRKLIIDRRSSHRARIIARNPLKRVYTSPKHFQQGLAALEKLVSKCEGLQHVLVLPVMADMSYLELRSPGIGRNIKQYNGMWEVFCATSGAKWILPETLNSDDGNALLGRDGIHLSVSGHEVVARIVADHLVPQERLNLP